MNRNLIFLVLILAVVGVVAGAFILNDDSEDAETTTTVLATPTIGIVSPTVIAASLIKNSMTNLGYIEGESIEYVITVVEDVDELETEIQMLVEQNVDVIVTMRAIEAQAVGNATSTIPIVFMANEEEFSDIVSQMSESREETNLTGVITINATEKRFDLLLQIIPTIETIYAPFDPNNALAAEDVRQLEVVTEAYDVTLKSREFTNEEELEQAFDEIPDDIDAIFMSVDPATLVRISLWADKSIERRIPAVFPIGKLPEGLLPPEVLMGYGSSVDELNQQVAELVDQILQGTAPADLPPRPSDIYLTLSMGAADALNIEIPDSVLRQANEIVRDTVVISTENTATESDVACNATLVSPLGESSICIINQCDLIQETNFASFVDRTEVATCQTEGLLGICSISGANDIYFYDGDITGIESGCLISGGEWNAPTE